MLRTTVTVTGVIQDVRACIVRVRARSLPGARRDSNDRAMVNDDGRRNNTASSKHTSVIRRSLLGRYVYWQLSLLWRKAVSHLSRRVVVDKTDRRLKTTTVISRGRPAAFAIKRH